MRKSVEKMGLEPTTFPTSIGTLYNNVAIENQLNTQYTSCFFWI